MNRKARERFRLSRTDRKVLQRRARGLLSPARDVHRARLLLGLDEGRAPLEVARALGTDKSQVLKWRWRYEAGGLDAVRDAPRSGRPRRLRERERIQVLSVACRAPEQVGVGRVLWSQKSLAGYLEGSGRVRRISPSSVQRILAAADLRPHKVRMWCTSNDPDYDRKVADVTGLYLEPPPGEVVLSIDEKTQMQALSRRVALRRAQPGRLGRQESDYDRHGTRCLLACFNVRTGKVVGRMSAITLWRGVSVTVLPGEASPWMRTIAALAQELSTDPHDDREPDGKPSGWARSRSCGPKPPHKATWGGGGACEAARRPGPAAGSATIGKRGRHTYVHGNTALPQGPPGPVHAPEGLQTPVERDVPQCSGDIAGVFRGSA